MQNGPLVRVARPGWDVRTCPDWAYLFNSDWPSLGIAFETTVATPAPVRVAHNLGYPPLAMCWAQYSGPKGYGRVSSSVLKVDSQYVYFLISTGTSMTVRCFNVDISKEQSYRLPTSAAAPLPYNDQFGVKVLKNGSNRLIYSKNLNDFIVHSRAQSPAVLSVATQKGKYYTTTDPGSQGAGPFIVYPVKTSYIPWAFGAVQISAGTYQYYSVNGLQLINGSLVFPLNTQTVGSLIVLRDPLFYPNTVRIVY